MMPIPVLRIRIGIRSDPDLFLGSGPFSWIWILSNFPDPVQDPDPTIKRSKSNKLNIYFCEKFTFFKIKPANSEKGGVGGRGGVAGVGVVGQEVVVKAEKQ